MEDVQRHFMVVFSAVFCWLAAITAAGLLFSAVETLPFESLRGALSVGVKAAVAVLFIWPCYRAVREVDRLDSLLLDFLWEKRVQLHLTALLLTLSILLLDVEAAPAGLINLSFRASSTVLSRPDVLFSGLLGEVFSSILSVFGRWYIHVFWLYMLSDTGYRIVTGLLKRTESAP